MFINNKPWNFSKESVFGDKVVVSLIKCQDSSELIQKWKANKDANTIFDGEATYFAKCLIVKEESLAEKILITFQGERLKFT